MELIAGSFLLTARVALAGGVWAGGGGGGGERGERRREQRGRKKKREQKEEMRVEKS